MLKNKTFLVAMIIFFAITLIVIIAMTFIFSDKQDEPLLTEDPSNNAENVLSIEDPAGSVDSGNFVIDESVYLAEETAKMTVTEEQRLRVEEEVVSLIEQREWEQARVILDTLFETHNAYSRDGAILKDYQIDIGIVNLMPQTDKQLYVNSLRGIKSAKVMLAASVYLPVQMKIGVFMDPDGIVPTPENPTLRFGNFSETTDHPYLERLDAMFPGEYLSIIEATFTLEGIEYTAYLAMTIDGYARIYRIETDDPDSYYMTVTRWNRLLMDIGQ